jgi:hypothetical protein
MDLSSAKKKYRTPSATSKQLSAPSLIQKVRMPARIETIPAYFQAQTIATEAVAFTDHAGGRQGPGCDRSQRGAIRDVSLRVMRALASPTRPSPVLHRARRKHIR